MKTRKHPRPAFFSEPLEARRLFSGVTILIHGQSGNITGWIASAAQAIAKRTSDPSQVSQYTMKVGNDSNHHLAVLSFALDAGPQVNKSSLAEAIIKLDWTDVDGGSVSTKDVGEVVANYLVAAHGKLRAFAELPIHLIGHSRGASVGVAISGQLAKRGIWVDQNTFLDPHPVDGHNDFLFSNFGDVAMKVYDNVFFADDYWRTSGQNPIYAIDPEGEPVTGAYNLNLQDSVQAKHAGSAHVAVTAYYHGTIDFNASSNGDSTIYDSWYDDSDSKPPRDQTGFYFSAIAGGARPADGIGVAFGGTAPRIAVTPEGPQWGNTTDIKTSRSSYHPGDVIASSFLRANRDGTASVDLLLDRDTDPYNGTNVATLTSLSVKGVSTPTLTNKINGTIPANTAPGTYYVCARIEDAQGHVRLSYSKPITVS